MAESRSNYKKTDMKLALINELRARFMTRKDIRDFLSDGRRRLGKVPANCVRPDSYKVSERTVKRILDSIRELYGDQLDFNKEFGTYKLDLRDFPDTIEDTEIQALDVAVKNMGNNVNARKLLENLKAKLTTRLYRKIEHTEPKRAAGKINDIDQKINSNYAAMGPRLIIDFDETVKNSLDSAISKQHEVSFMYNNRRHTVCPLGIMHGPNNVYLIAQGCQAAKSRGGMLHYILSKISNLTETQNWFARDENFSIANYANSMFGIYNDGVVYDIEWLIKDQNAIKVAKKYIFHPTQELIDNPDGSLTVKMRTGGLHAISVFLAQWDGKIIPVQPQELIVKYESLLRNCLASIKK